MIKIKRLTKKELKKFVADYSDLFRGWEMLKSGDAFIRTQKPITQMVWFDSLSFGAYRPTNTIFTCVGPEVSLYAQFLDIKHRAIEPREHPLMCAHVLKAIKEQFKPSIQDPLNLEEILSFCESKASGNTSSCIGLGMFNAYLGHKDRALEWCQRYPAAFDKLVVGRKPADWEIKETVFIEQLRAAIEKGEERQFLDKNKCQR